MICKYCNQVRLHIGVTMGFMAVITLWWEHKHMLIVLEDIIVNNIDASSRDLMLFKTHSLTDSWIFFCFCFKGTNVLEIPRLWSMSALKVVFCCDNLYLAGRVTLPFMLCKSYVSSSTFELPFWCVNASCRSLSNSMIG